MYHLFFDKQLHDLKGQTGPEAQALREKLKRLAIEHETEHLGDRAVLDEAGFLAYTNPRLIWCIMCDAATQRNFELPKFGFCVPKSMGKPVNWKFTLMGTYAYGFGFTPYLCDESVKHGSNLTLTCLWDTMCRMHDRHGVFPQVLHLQFDNCSGDNKNKYVFAFAAWLVFSGRVKQVRFFFLQVGHTHILIDQIFGVITVGLRRRELALPADLIENVNASLEVNPQYQAHPTRWLRTLLDYKTWAEDELKVLNDSQFGHLSSSTQAQDEEGAFPGFYDLLISPHTEYGAAMQYRERIWHFYWPENHPGVQVIKTLPANPPKLASMNHESKFLTVGTSDFWGTLAAAKRFLRSLSTPATTLHFHETWSKHIQDIKVDPYLMAEELQMGFRMFELELPRLTGPTGGDSRNSELSEESSNEEEAFKQWKVHFMGLRCTPFAYDPVIGSHQTSAAYKAVRSKFQMDAMVVAGASAIPTTKIFLGHLVIARNPASLVGHGVDVYAVEGFGKMQLPSSLDVDLKCSSFLHAPNSEVSGLWGSFTRIPFKTKPAVHLSRRDIVLYNVGPLFTNNSKKYLPLETLRLLSRHVPEYAMPTHVPDSHVSKNDPKKNPKSVAPARKPPTKKNARGKKAASDSEETSDEGDDDDADEAGEESEVEEEEGSEDDGDTLEESSEGTSSAAEGPSLQPPVVSMEPPSEPSSVPPAHQLPKQTVTPLLELPQPLPALLAGEIGFANLVSDNKISEHALPVLPFMLSTQTTTKPDHIMVHYFQPLEPFRMPTAIKMANGDYTRKTIAYSKYWHDVSFGKYKAAYQSRSKNSLINKKSIPDAYFQSNWPAEELEKRFVLNVVAPPGLLKDVIRGENITFRMSFFMEVLLPLCRSMKIIPG